MKPQHRKAARATLLITCLLPGCSHANATAEKGPTPVKIQTVEEGETSALSRYSGSLEPAARVDMAFRVSGYVDALGQVVDAHGRRAIDKGDFVKKGSVLARIRTSDYAQKLATAEAQTGEARAEAQLADVELARAQRLLDSKAITKAELDTKSARAERARAAVAGALARAAEADGALDDTILRAPFDGVVLARPVEVGMLVGPGQQAFTIADTQSMKAVFGVSESQVDKLSLGSPLQVFLRGERDTGAPERGIDAVVTRIAPAADSLGRVFAVEAALSNEAGVLRPGAVVSVHLASANAASLAVPLSAVVRSALSPRGFAVFVLAGSADRAPVQLRDVTLGQVLGNAVSVRAGLDAGERVVTVGSTLLRDGDDAVVIR